MGRSYPDKQESQASAEARMVGYLVSLDDRPALQGAVTVDSLLRSHNVSAKVAQYRLMLAQQRWAVRAAGK